VQAQIGYYTGNVVRVPSLAEDTAASYRISLIRSGAGDESWLAEVDGLPNCSRRGTSPEEAVQRAWAAVEAVVGPAAERSEEQKSTAAPKHSGKLLVRMPATLHDELARAAEAEGVSLNQLITGVLAGAVEWRSGDQRAPRSPVAGDAAPETLSARLTRAALAANLAVVLIAAILAVALLVAAWRAGF
jgi:predicted HicB family RNase H-like nuclease